MKTFLIVHVCNIISFISFASATRVLVAGDEETFRDFAKKFDPQKLANQLVSLVTKATEQYGAVTERFDKDTTRYGTATERYDEATERYDKSTERYEKNLKQYNKDIERHDKDTERYNKDTERYDEDTERYDKAQYYEDRKEAPTNQNREYRTAYEKDTEPPDIVIRRDSSQKPKIQINMDELVEKVKDRILIDLKSTLARPLPKASSAKQLLEVEGNIRPKKKTPKGSVNRPNRFEIRVRPSREEVIENNDYFEKVMLKPAKKDSYEDYVMPKKDDDIFESEHNDPKVRQEHDYEAPQIYNNQNRQYNQETNNRYNKRQPTFEAPYNIEREEEIDNYNRKRTQRYSRMPSRTKKLLGSYIRQTTNYYNRPNAGNYYYSKPNYFNRQKTVNHLRQPTDNYNDQANDNYDVFDRTSNKLNRQTRSTYDDIIIRMDEQMTQSTTKVEYVDNYDTETTVDFEPKALTEYLLGDYSDEPVPNTQSTKHTPGGYQNTKRIYKKIQTNMAVRERFKISTPNYYEKLAPKVAEKYNFNEPLPEKDREEENLKPIGNPPAAINGKIKV